MPSGTYQGGPVVLALLLRSFLHLLLLHISSGSSCPSVCLCTSDRVSCGSMGLTRPPLEGLPASCVTLDLGYNQLARLAPGAITGVPRLEALLLAHNQLASLAPGVFGNVSATLRHLDLSSNQLRTVETHYFQGLWRLEELLLFNNRLSQVEGGALSGLGSLRKAYFSLNHLAHFPFFSVRDHSHPFLSTLDLSSNRLGPVLPWDDVKALPGLAQRGLHLHNNSLLACDCHMYSVFWHWEARGFQSLRDFGDQYTCTVYGEPHSTAVRFLQNPPRFFFRNCSARRITTAAAVALPVTVSSLWVFEGERVQLDCQTSLSVGSGSSATSDLWYAWQTPGQGYVTTGSLNDSSSDHRHHHEAAAAAMSLFANGTLEVSAATLNDSGLYVCTASSAVDSARNATREVNVTVTRPATEPFSEGYTTLLGCAVTMVLILVYLYLTPCRCRCCKPPGGGGGGRGGGRGRGSKQSLPTSVLVGYEPNSLCPVFSQQFSTRVKPPPMVGYEPSPLYSVFSAPSSTTRVKSPSLPEGLGRHHVAFIDADIHNGLQNGRLVKTTAADHRPMPSPSQWEWETRPPLSVTPYTAAIVEM